MSPVFPRDLTPSVAKIARSVYGASIVRTAGATGETEAAKSTSAPATGEARTLGDAPIVSGTLELRRSDGHLYLPGVDYTETPTGFQNLRIPAGTPLAAEYAHEEEPEPRYRFEGGRIYEDPTTGETVVEIPATSLPEPSTLLTLTNGWVNYTADAESGPAAGYKDRERVHLEGVVSGGAVAIGTVLLTFPEGWWPGYRRRLTASSDAGPVILYAERNGNLTIGDGAFVAGSGWLSLDGLSFRTGLPAGLYPHTALYPHNELFPY